MERGFQDLCKFFCKVALKSQCDVGRQIDDRYLGFPTMSGCHLREQAHNHDLASAV